MEKALLEIIVLKEHSKNQTDLIVEFVGADKEKFKALVSLFLKSSNEKIRQRLAWPLSYLIENNHELIQPYWIRFVNLLKDPSLHPAIHRNLLRSFQFVDIPEKFRGTIMDYCFNVLTTPNSAPAFKAYAITILEKLAKDYPEILPEFLLILKDQFETESPAFRSRARSILKKFNI